MTITISEVYFRRWGGNRPKAPEAIFLTNLYLLPTFKIRLWDAPFFIDYAMIVEKPGKNWGVSRWKKEWMTVNGNVDVYTIWKLEGDHSTTWYGWLPINDEASDRDNDNKWSTLGTAWRHNSQMIHIDALMFYRKEKDLGWDSVDLPRRGN